MASKSKRLPVAVSPEIAAFAVVIEKRLQLEGFHDADKWNAVPIRGMVDALQRNAGRLTGTARPSSSTGT